MGLVDLISWMDTRLQIGTVLVGLTTFLAVRRVWRTNIPGPWGLPVLGNLHEFIKEPRMSLLLTNWSKKYGDVYIVTLGFQDTVVVNSLEAALEVLVKKSNDFAGRLVPATMKALLGSSQDIVMGDFNPTWKIQKHLCHQAIRKFASGAELEGLVQRSMAKSIPLIEAEKGPVNMERQMTLLTYNILAALCFGKTFEMDDPFFTKIVDINDRMTDAFGNGTLADVYPCLEFLPNQLKSIMQEFATVWFGYIHEALEEHKATFDGETITDLTYQFIETQREIEAGEGKEKMAMLTEDHLINIISDIFLGGMDTTRMTLTWLAAYMAKYPEIQKKCQQEIDSVVDRDDDIMLKHRSRLPYTQAMLNEVLRVRPPLPILIPHLTTCDTSVGGFEVPKDTQIFVNLWNLHFDPRYWEEPEEFRPERFLDANGGLAPKPPAFLPFSAGRRGCAGETLAKAELHLLAAMLLQNFTFSAPPDTTLDVGVSDASGLFIIPKNVKVLVERRK